MYGDRVRILAIFAVINDLNIYINTSVNKCRKLFFCEGNLVLSIESATRYSDKLLTYYCKLTLELVCTKCKSAGYLCYINLSSCPFTLWLYPHTSITLANPLLFRIRLPHELI